MRVNDDFGSNGAIHINDAYGEVVDGRRMIDDFNGNEANRINDEYGKLVDGRRVSNDFGGNESATRLTLDGTSHSGID